MKTLFRGALICSLVVAGFGVLFHYYNVTPNDWAAVAMWIPIYISPIWGIAGWSHFSNRKKE